MICMKILIVCGGFYPAQNHRGPVVSIDNFINLLADYNFYMITSDKDWKSSERLDGIIDGWNNYRNRCQVLYLRDNEYNYQNIESIIKSIEPDLIYANFFFLAKMQLPVLKAAKKMHIPILDAPRGVLCKNALSLKPLKKKVYLKLINKLIDRNRYYCQSTSNEETEQLQRILKINRDHIFETSNIPSIPNSSIDNIIKTKDELICGFFARICEKKNLKYAIRILSNVSGNVTLNIYGKIEEEEYWNDCKEQINSLPENIRVIYKGTYEHSDVFSLMAKNNVFFFPTLSENYGHVIAEALFTGLPVIISDQTPWNETEKYRCGYSIPLKDDNKFIKAIESYVGLNELEFCELRKNARRYAEEKSSLVELKREYENMIKVVSKNRLE